MEYRIDDTRTNYFSFETHSRILRRLATKKPTTLCAEMASNLKGKWSLWSLDKQYLESIPYNKFLFGRDLHLLKNDENPIQIMRFIISNRPPF